jgi:hypothetical protein
MQYIRQSVGTLLNLETNIQSEVPMKQARPIPSLASQGLIQNNNDSLLSGNNIHRMILNNSISLRV